MLSNSISCWYNNNNSIGNKAAKCRKESRYHTSKIIL